MDLTDAQWKRIEPLLPKSRMHPDGRGHPWRAPRDVLNGVLWVIRTEVLWHDLPDRYPSHQTCHRRFQIWARELAGAGGYDFTEAFIDATFAGAKKGVPASASPAKAKTSRSWHSHTVLPLLSQ